MEPLEINRQILTWLCLYSWDESTSKKKKVAIIIFTLSVFIANLCGVVASIVFFKRAFSVDMESCLYSIYQIAAFSNCIYVMIVAFFLRNRISDIFRRISDIQHTSK